MLHLQYIGLLNTDRRSKGPVRMYLQGSESQERYVLDRLPPWIAELLGQTQTTCADTRYIAGVNLGLCNQKTREAMYRALSEGGYKVRQVSGKAEYLEVSQVFAP